MRLDRARITTVALFSLMAGPAHAQRLLEVEGIELRGAAGRSLDHLIARYRIAAENLPVHELELA